MAAQYRLTWDKVRKIRASDETIGQLAETYNVSPSHIINILNNRKWDYMTLLKTRRP